jgi:ABC-type nitrate/sulfonate/bicarbonate transport system substrate-binding protein
VRPMPVPARLMPLLVGAGVLALAACGGASEVVESGSNPTSQADSQQVTLMLNWTPNAHHVGVYAAQASGWYDEAGIDLTIIEPADAGVEQAVATGAADIGMAQAESLLPARAAGVPVVSVAAVLPVNDSALFSLADDQITRPRDLAGTRYGGFGGALETEIISSLMRCDGADPATVEFVTLGNIDYLAGMSSDQFDTAWVFSGWDALRAEAVEGEPVAQIRFADWQDCIPNWYTPLFLAAESTLADDPGLVSDFLAVTARGYQLAVDDPDAAAQLLLDEVPELDEALVEPAVRYYAPLFVAAGQSWGEQDETTWTTFADFLTTATLIDDPVDGASAFTNDYLPE